MWCASNGIGISGLLVSLSLGTGPVPMPIVCGTPCGSMRVYACVCAGCLCSDKADGGVLRNVNGRHIKNLPPSGPSRGPPKICILFQFDDDSNINTHQFIELFAENLIEPLTLWPFAVLAGTQSAGNATRCLVRHNNYKSVLGFPFSPLIKSSNCVRAGKASPGSHTHTAKWEAGWRGRSQNPGHGNGATHENNQWRWRGLHFLVN